MLLDLSQTIVLVKDDHAPIVVVETIKPASKIKGEPCPMAYLRQTFPNWDLFPDDVKEALLQSQKAYKCDGELYK